MNSRFNFISLLGILLVVALSGCSLPTKDITVPEPLMDSAQTPMLLLEGKPFTPQPEPAMIDGRLYLPFIESLELLGMSVESYPDSNAITVYHDNRFLKINTETLTLSRNGKILSKKQAPVLINETLYVPATLLFNSFDMGVSYPKDGVVAIDYQKNKDNPQLVDGEYYVPITVKDFDLHFSVPKTWARLPGSPYRFGESTYYDDYQITFLTRPLEKQSDSELLIQLADEAGKSAGVTLFENQVSPLHVNGLEGLTASFYYDKNDTTGQMILYIFKRDNTAIIFQGWINTAMDEQAVIRQITSIARSLRFGDMVVDVQQEHYIEAPAFFENGITLTEPLYSNMELQGKLTLSGTVAERGIKWLFVAINRGGESITQRIPVVDKAFFSNVYTPFGLGKHDLTFYASEDEQKPQDRILQVSVVNTSPQETRWMIPSILIDSENDYITSQSSLLTYKTYGDYMKARQLFSWVVETISLETARKDPDTASKVYLKKSGTEEDIAVIYTALLRATQIPARIVSNSDDPLHTWVEMQMNGQWVESDPAAAIRRMKNGAPLTEAVDAHFNMSRAYFEERYPVIETSPW